MTINEQGAVIGYDDYPARDAFRRYPFGKAMPRRNYLVGEGLTKNLYTGKEKDDETGLYYFGARYYCSETEIRPPADDPAIRRWLSVDPMAHLYPSHSPYNYVGNNPLRRIDPTGMFWEELGNWITGNGWRTQEEMDTPATEEAGDAAEWAEDQQEDNSKKYTLAAEPEGDWKCNKFVGDAYTKGAKLKKSTEGEDEYPTYQISNDYAVANDMASDKYNPETFITVPASEAKVGDIIVFPNKTTSGHMGVKGEGNTFIDARRNEITKENFTKVRLTYLIQGRGVVVRRYVKK